jgi:uncharacterized protein YggU (UPF0235/DUF167 family)
LLRKFHIRCPVIFFLRSNFFCYTFHMLIKVKAIAGAKEESWTMKARDAFTISVREKAEDNRANERIRQILAEYFKTGNIRLIHGHHSPSKIFEVGEESFRG